MQVSRLIRGVSVVEWSMLCIALQNELNNVFSFHSNLISTILVI